MLMRGGENLGVLDGLRLRRLAAYLRKFLEMEWTYNYCSETVAHTNMSMSMQTGSEKIWADCEQNTLSHLHVQT